MITGFFILRSAFTVAVVGSTVVVKRQVKKRRKQQEEEGVRSTIKLSWEEKVKEFENSNNKVEIRTEK